MLKIKDMMTTPVVSVAPNSLIEDALDVMLKHRISGLPVIDDEGHLVGVISEFDILLLLCEDPEEYNPVAPVVHFMSQTVETIDEETPVTAAVEVFRRMLVRRLPVVKDGVVVGILSRRDLVGVIRDQRKEAFAAPWSDV